jgi:NTE family protein
MDPVSDPEGDQVRAGVNSTPAETPCDGRLCLKDKHIVLLLQGGGALGAYQVGAFEALAKECAKTESKIEWVAGISIGAINSAVIAAPKSGDPVRELELLWDEILSPELPYTKLNGLMGTRSPMPWESWLSSLGPRYMDWAWMAFNPRGQANFFSSRVLNPFSNPWVLQWFRKLERNELGFYDTRQLAETLDRHVNWKALDQADNTRLSVGATHLHDGEVKFFNSWETPLSADHVRASGALPPAFPPIQIGNDWYFDGGISNNTPIEVLAENLFCADKDMLVFLIDLWDRKNDVHPESLEDLMWRQKCIQYGSRKKEAEIVVERYEIRAQRGHLKRPAPARLEVCEVMLERDDQEPQFTFADADFSRSTFRKLRAQGSKDTMEALRRPELVTDVEGRPLGGSYASLYRYGSQGKWKIPRSEHRHKPSKRANCPSGFKQWTDWLKLGT